MLRQVSNGQYLEAIRMAEKFILHVEVLFATIDDLEHYFARLNLKGKFSGSVNLWRVLIDIHEQACRMSERPVCSAERPSISSLSSRTPKRPAPAEWA